MIDSRPAGDSDSVGGVTPRLVYEPRTIEDAADVIASSEKSGQALAFVGGGTDLEAGLPPERLDAVIRTSALDRLVEHAPSDQIVRVEAGMTLARLQELVGAHGQRLALDPPNGDRATIGGIVAANPFGPLRTRYGSVRDLIIGISIVRADGVVARGGGKVVKNVAGFDLPRLMVGSFGTLGLITTATFRLHPSPEVSETLLVRSRSASQIRQLVNDMRTAQLEPAAMAAIARENTFDVMVRFEGFRAGVVEQRDRSFALACARGSCELLDGADAAQQWRRHDDIRTAGPLRLKIAALPSAIEMLSTTAIPQLTSALKEAGFVWYPTFGVGFVTGTPASEQAAVGAISNARQALAAEKGSLTIQAAPAAIRQSVDVWGHAPGIALMREMKMRFDPGRRLSPGRFVGGI